MKKAEVIIGGGFGDEGKGLFTDYLTARSDKKTCVVRFNGGAQAGHTVQLADGRRHVFSHFGSGTYANAPTFLSSFFACNPITFLREKAELEKDGFSPELYVDPACPVTTPYDIMINQIVEEFRGSKRHGSVGVGFGETIERSGCAPFSLRADELHNVDALRQKLDNIREIWLPHRLRKLGVTEWSEKWTERASSEGILEHFIEDCARFHAETSLAPLSSLHRFEHLVFEGAQGLLLDQSCGYFPHVTRSNTGMQNAVVLAEKLGLEELDLYYLTRSYVTRHGAGPLPHELPTQPYAKIVDPTNKSHRFQGDLRFAWLDIDLFQRAVIQDRESYRTSVALRTCLGMSCLDQIDEAAFYIKEGVKQATNPEGLLQIVGRAIGAQNSLASYGPTRHTIREVAVTAAKPLRVGVFDRVRAFNVAQKNMLSGLCATHAKS